MPTVRGTTTSLPKRAGYEKKQKSFITTPLITTVNDGHANVSGRTGSLTRFTQPVMTKSTMQEAHAMQIEAISGVPILPI